LFFFYLLQGRSASYITLDQGIGEVQEIPTSEGFGSDLPPGRRVTITFHAYDGGNWRRTDTVIVSSDNPHEAQNIADHYAQDQSNIGNDGQVIEDEIL
jgi:hypothetical protein